MKLFQFFSTHIVASFVLLSLLVGNVSAAEQPRAKRSECFFGLHFDFHARDTDVDIGKNTTHEMIERIIDQVNPDYLQVDCKGHKGYSSYPTKVGNPAPSLVGDPLKVWRDVTAKRGIPLIMHYSGVIDLKAVQDHPDWCVVDASGKPSGRSTSLFSPYADNFMIPQLKELAVNYGVDGIWIDGDNWGVNPDWSPAAVEGFKKTTGFEAPKKPTDPHWFEWMEFHRDAFRRYLAHYISEVKKVAPNCQIASNWAFSDRMPEKVACGVDFLSGDVIPAKAQQELAICAYYLAGQGHPWDLMSWGFTTMKEGEEKKVVYRTAEDLIQEAARIISLGGGYEIYLKQERDGSIKQDLAHIAEIAKFCRARKPYCFEGKAVPQVAILHSTANHYRESERPFKPNVDIVRDTLSTITGIKYSVELLSEHRLTGRMKEYPLIVIPNTTYLEPSFKNELLNYVKEGGQLLLIGAKSANLFSADLDVKIEFLPETEEEAKKRPRHIDPPIKITLGSKAKPVDIPIKSKTPVIFTDPGASETEFGKGRIAAIYHSKPVGPLVEGVARRLFPEPIVEIKNARIRQIAISHIQSKLAINLVSSDSKPQGPAEIQIRLPAAPTKLTLQPANEPLQFKYENGKAIATLPKLEVLDIVMVE